MKRIHKAGAFLAAVLMSVSLLPAPVLAEEYETQGTCWFNGSTLESDFLTDVLVEQVRDLQPGDSISFSVTFRNDYEESTEWYMESEILQTLEKTAAAKKVPGLGTAKAGGYIYELIHYDKNGNADVLFGENAQGDIETIGGGTESGDSATYGGREGLEQATNATEEWFWIETLKKGESGRIVLNITFDGETEVNDYMDTDGGLAVRFSVELTPKSTPQNPTPTGKKAVSGVNTGDATQFVPFVVILAAGVAILIVLLVLRRRNAKGGKEQ